MRSAVIFLTCGLWFMLGFILGSEAADPRTTRYTFTYGPAPSTADLLANR